MCVCLGPINLPPTHPTTASAQNSLMKIHSLHIFHSLNYKPYVKHFYRCWLLMELLYVSYYAIFIIIQLFFSTNWLCVCIDERITFHNVSIYISRLIFLTVPFIQLIWHIFLVNVKYFQHVKLDRFFYFLFNFYCNYYCYWVELIVL